MKHYFWAAMMAAIACVFTACSAKESVKKQLVLYYS